MRVLLVKSGVQALIFYRFYHKLYRIRLRVLAEIVSGCRICHPAGVVIGRGVKIGENVSILSNVTLGGLGHSIFHHGEPGYTEIGNNVNLYTNVTVLGPVKIGDNTTVGSHSLVLDSIPENCLAAGTPAKIIKRL